MTTLKYICYLKITVTCFDVHTGVQGHTKVISRSRWICSKTSSGFIFNLLKLIISYHIFVQASLFKMMAMVEKVEPEMEDITHQISQEERTLESGSSKPDVLKKYGSRFWDVAVLSVFTCLLSQVWNGLPGYSRGQHCRKSRREG